MKINGELAQMLKFEGDIAVLRMLFYKKWRRLNRARKEVDSVSYRLWQHRPSLSDLLLEHIVMDICILTRKGPQPKNSKKLLG